MDFITLFLENLTGMPLPSISIDGAGTLLTSIGSSLMDSDNEALETLGSISTGLGLSLFLDGEDAYEKTKQQLEITQAYIESLDQTELEELIAKLEIKETQLTLEEENYTRTLVNRHNNDKI